MTAIKSNSPVAFEITDIDGVFGAGISCGIKSGDKSGKKDLAYLFVPNATACAAVATKNLFCAPCIEHNRACLESGTIKAIVVNSGNANAATGAEGAKHVQQTAQAAAELLGLAACEVAISSTGIIGVPLPIAKVLDGLSILLKDPSAKGGDSVSQAILTTDLCSKKVALERSVGGVMLRIAGIAKGSGMIAPNMATMLSYLAIDAAVPQELLQKLFSNAVDESFNMVSVDTDTSTSDMALLFATGSKRVDLDNDSIEALQGLITDACISLAQQIARDGEGATKLIEVRVVGARTIRDARRLAKNIIDSPLVKTAIHGADPNWGRVMMALGKDPEVTVEPNRAEIRFGEYLIFSEGRPREFSEPDLVALLKRDTVRITADLQIGSAAATAWGCDLTKGYIDINTDYN